MPMATKHISLKNSLDSVSYALGVNVARTLNGQGFDTLNYEAFNTAIAASLNADSLLLDQTHSLRYINTYLQGMTTALLANNLEIATHFLDSVSRLKDVKKIADGVFLRIIKQGAGVPPGMNDEVVFNYLGQLPDGREFDNAFERGVPAVSTVDALITGWQDALTHLAPGSVAEVWLHPDKGYGTHGAYNGIIPGNAALYFKLELVEVHKK